MARKSLSEIYHGAHRAKAEQQNTKYHNPITEAPAHVPAVLEAAVTAGELTDDQARKLASKLGRGSYGERGLNGIVDTAVRAVLGTPNWQLAHRLNP